MAILFTDGFDSYGLPTTEPGTSLITRWTLYSPGLDFVTLSTNTPWSYGQSLYVGGTCSVSFINTPTITIGMAINSRGFGGSNDMSIDLLSDNTSMIELRYGPNGRIEIYRAGTLIGSPSAPNVVQLNKFSYIELSVTISDTVGTVRVDVDGQTVINQSGLDTRNGTPTTVNTLRLRRVSGTGASFFVDDLYISDSITPLGPQQIYTLRPNADTIEKDWVPSSGATNYLMVDDVVVDADATYVTASTVGDYDLYDIPNYPVATGTIQAVNHIVWARKTDAATRTITSTIKSGATTTDSSQYTLSANFVGYSTLYEANPNTSASWTVTDINNLQIGQKVAS